MDGNRPLLMPLGKDIWLANGAEAMVAGFRYPTRMAVIRLAGARLLLWSPVRPTPALRAAVEALGEIAHLVAPNSLHHLSIADWQRAYPSARTWAPPGLRRKRPDLTFDADLGDVAPAEWAVEVDQVAVRGNLITTELVFFHRVSRTVLFTDLLQHFDRGWFSGWRAMVARLDLMTAPHPEVPRKFRMAFVDRAAARGAIERILAWPIETLVMAHGAPVSPGGRAAVERAFRWLRPNAPLP
ncbi:DUF4336 domain-containing protein [Sphingoaurantiacus capsulatus]|uniref:DUF4336 domain-containing protein n=1 Tax=Sphingoaurantiacus capsulatus TaxID=1771310 RepID=A0ABV7XBK2_9SPHN